MASSGEASRAVYESVTGGGPEFLTMVPPAVFVLAAALLLPFLSRRVGHGLGVVATGGAVAWAALVPHGDHLAMTFLGFDAVLFNADDLSVLMGIIFAFIGAIAVTYSYATDADNVQTAFALLYVGTSLGAVFAGDWLTFAFFIELMAVASTLVVWHYGGEAVRSGFRYALWHGIGGSLVLGAVVWHYVEVGSFLFSAADGLTPGIPAALYAIGFGVNVGYIGLHVWLPDTYPAPHIAASVFLCVYTTKTGVYALGRAFPDGQIWLAYMGGGMAVFGAFMALMQNDMRRLLSYHIQSQVGYMVAGVGIGTALSYAGAFAHVFNHILYKSLLFMCAGAIIYRTGVSNLKKLGGLRSEMPLTMGIFVVAALSISGFPGFNGFVSKGMVVAAAHKEHMDALWYILLAGGVGTFASFIKFGYYAFFHGDPQETVSGIGLNGLQKVSMGSVAVLCTAYGLYPRGLFVLLPGTGASKAHPFTLGHIAEGVILGVIAVVLFVVFKKPLEKAGGKVPDLDSLYNPAAFFGTRGGVVGVTELYAAADRAAVRLATGSMWVARNPVSALQQRAPWALPGDPNETDNGVRLQATIGQSTFLIVAVLAGALVVLFAVL
jgi:multicomponent Na+:H+ antiporter subunit D